MNKLTLKYEIELNFILMAVTCPLRDYRFCYYVNKVAGLHLAKDEDHEISFTTAGQLFFSRYIYINPVSDTEFYVISNRGIAGGLLIPEMKGADFFLMIRNFIDDEDLTFLHQAINGIPDVLAVHEVDPYKLKSKENLVF